MMICEKCNKRIISDSAQRYDKKRDTFVHVGCGGRVLMTGP